MFVNFGKGKCPVCGDFGLQKSSKKVFHCSKCKILFDEFSIFGYENLRDYEDKYWN